MKFKFIKSKDFDFIRSLIKNWDEFREDSGYINSLGHFLRKRNF